MAMCCPWGASRPGHVGEGREVSMGLPHEVFTLISITSLYAQLISTCAFNCTLPWARESGSIHSLMTKWSIVGELFSLMAPFWIQLYLASFPDLWLQFWITWSNAGDRLGLGTRPTIFVCSHGNCKLIRPNITHVFPGNRRWYKTTVST